MAAQISVFTSDSFRVRARKKPGGGHLWLLAFYSRNETPCSVRQPTRHSERAPLLASGKVGWLTQQLCWQTVFAKRRESRNLV